MSIDTAFYANENKPFQKLKDNNGQTNLQVIVELDGKAPGLPTNVPLNPSGAWPLHDRRPSDESIITADSNVKAEDIEIELLRRAKHPERETGARMRGSEFSLENGGVGLKSHGQGGSDSNFSAEWEYERARDLTFEGFGVDDLDYLIAGGKQVLENIFRGKYSNWWLGERVTLPQQFRTRYRYLPARMF